MEDREESLNVPSDVPPGALRVLLTGFGVRQVFSARIFQSYLQY